ncbi:MAG: hypothetical protein U0263_36520 [Polyangiaceae bacterium]
MAPESRILVVVEPALIDRVASYLDEPRKRESIVLSLAEPAAGPASITGTVERAPRLRRAWMGWCARGMQCAAAASRPRTNTLAVSGTTSRGSLRAQAFARGAGCCSLAMLAYLNATR